MHEDKTRVRTVFLQQQQVVDSLEECSSGGILHKTDLLLYHFFAPLYAKWSRFLTIAVEHSDIAATVDLKWTEESLIFYGDVPQEERDLHLQVLCRGVAAFRRNAGRSFLGSNFPHLSQNVQLWNRAQNSRSTASSVWMRGSPSAF